MDLFFQSVAQQTQDRTQGVIPDMESYLTVRRDNSGCKPCFQLTEFAAGIDLPEEVVQHPIIQSLEEATNDLVTWSNVRRPVPLRSLRVLLAVFCSNTALK
jgi:hypothetical protein